MPSPTNSTCAITLTMWMSLAASATHRPTQPPQTHANRMRNFSTLTAFWTSL
jgi:hypothetical protein